MFLPRNSWEFKATKCQRLQRREVWLCVSGLCVIVDSGGKKKDNGSFLVSPEPKKRIKKIKKAETQHVEKIGDKIQIKVMVSMQRFPFSWAAWFRRSCCQMQPSSLLVCRGDSNGGVFFHLSSLLHEVLWLHTFAQLPSSPVLTKQQQTLRAWLTPQYITAFIIMSTHYLPCFHIKMYLYTQGHNLIPRLIAARFMSLLGAVEEAQKAFSQENCTSDRQFGKPATATAPTLVPFMMWFVCLSTDLYGIKALCQLFLSVELADGKGKTLRHGASFISLRCDQFNWQQPEGQLGVKTTCL